MRMAHVLSYELNIGSSLNKKPVNEFIKTHLLAFSIFLEILPQPFA